MDDPNRHLELYQGLKALSDASFPKKCASCGRQFGSLNAFIRETQSVSKGVSGLKRSLDGAKKSIVELYRNCPCGSTLMDCFDDRRDTTAWGTKHRALFGKLMRMLIVKGLASYRARRELHRILKGEYSSVLAKMGIETRKL